MNAPEHSVLGTDWRLSHSLGSGCIPYYRHFSFLLGCALVQTTNCRSSHLCRLTLICAYRIETKTGYTVTPELDEGIFSNPENLKTNVELTEIDGNEDEKETKFNRK
jgi:hypothetical protein